MPAEHQEPPQETAGRYASLFTHHPHAAYSVDRRGYYTDANQRALDMTGLSLDEMRRTHFAQVIHPDDVHLLEEAFELALAGSPQVVDARVLRADGGVVDVRCTAIPLVVGARVVGVHGITEDITEARRVLRELEGANAAKTRFLATVSHEVRTPLAAMIGASELLLETDLPHEPAHYAQIVHRSAERLMRLAHDLLEFSELETHRTVLGRSLVHVRDLVEDVAAWAELVADDREVEVRCVVEESVPYAGIGDGTRIAQVVRALVHNAVKFTERGHVDVRVTTPHATEDGADEVWVEFEVSDTGIGIAADQLPILFEPLTQAAPHGSGDRQGNGLGLAIVRELTDLMHGRLEVRSVLGEGSTFTFSVPLGRPADAGSVG